jgi:CSLREA domain-containing protein
LYGHKEGDLTPVVRQFQILLLRAFMSANGFVGATRRFSPFRVLSNLLVNCIWLVPILLTPAKAAYASTYTVTNLSDSGTGSLRSAITSANTDPAGTIVFASGLTGTITLQSSLPNVALTSGSMTITGPGANKLAISGQGKYQVLVIVKGTATISGVTITDGFVAAGGGYTTDPGWGAAFYTAAGTTLNLQNDVLTNNVTAGGGGGAILSEGTLNITGSTFSGNSVTSTDGGAGIFNIGILTVSGSTFSYNTAVNEGSAIVNYGGGPVGTATIVNSTFANNVVPPGGGGGAIYNQSGATLTVRDSTFSGNLPTTGGSLANAGTMTLSDNIFAEPNSTSYQCTADALPASQCPPNPSGPDANGNFDEPATSLNLLPLGYYGGLNQTMLPQVGSALICGGETAGAKTTSGATLTGDERGFGLDPSCATGKVDAGAVQANYLIVTTTADPGTGSCGATCALRDAITEANAVGHADIDFAPAVTGTITLGSELPVISGEADIVGPGANALTVSGNNATPIFGVTSGTLDISGLTIANGKSASNGGAIANTSGLVTLSNAYLSGNSATSDGGAINNGGTLLVSDSTFSGNKAVLGSAIYNTGAVGLEYSTVAGNAASSAGGIYNNSGSILTAASSTFAGNSGGTGAGIDNLGALSMTNSITDAGAECAGSGCPASGNGNVVGATHLAPLGYYGGVTPTVLPQPSSSAICAGLEADIPANALSDQRGFANENLAYAGYSATAPCVDSGAVQTNYTAVQFAAAGPYAAIANTPGTTPGVVVSVTENGQNIGGVSVTLMFSGTGLASGLTASTVAGTGATFGSLVVTQPSASGDTLSVSLPVVGTDTLTAAPVALTVTGKTTPTVTTWPTASPLNPGQTLASSTLTGGVASVQGNFAFTIPGTVPPSGTSSQSVTFTPADTADYNAVVGSVNVTVGTPTPIVPYIEVNGGSWQTTATVTVQITDLVNLGPQPLTGGSWSWTGPNGYTSTSRQINSIPLTLPTNVFVATYTNSAGVKSTQAFTINVAPTAITPYIEVNGGAWLTAASVTVQATDLINLGPQPLTGGSWSWTGPNGYTSTARQINSVPLTSATNVFVATYTNPAGVKSTQTFTVNVAPTPITPYIQVNGGVWQATSSVLVFQGMSVNLGPQPLTGGSWSWTGPNRYTSTSRQVNNVPLSPGFNTFVVTYTNPAGVKSAQTFTILAL